MTIDMLEAIRTYPPQIVPMLKTLVTVVANGAITVKRFAGRPWFLAVFASQAEKVQASTGIQLHAHHMVLRALYTYGHYGRGHAH